LVALADWANKTKRAIDADPVEEHALTIFAQAAELLEPDPVSFESFLHRMSRGLVDAQQLLDVESANYLTSIADKPHILPSIFRVPKLSAKMRFALKVGKGAGLNLLFFSRRTETESQNEQATALVFRAKRDGDRDSELLAFVGKLGWPNPTRNHIRCVPCEDQRNRHSSSSRRGRGSQHPPKPTAELPQYLLRLLVQLHNWRRALQ
jgi:hypothetical protein